MSDLSFMVRVISVRILSLLSFANYLMMQLLFPFLNYAFKKIREFVDSDSIQHVKITCSLQD